MTTTTTKIWTPEQQKILSWFRGEHDEVQHLVVRARAGTGKTTVALEGMKLAPESKIYYGTFNKRPTAEMAEKVERAGIGGFGGKVQVKTTNSLGCAFIKPILGKLEYDDAVEYDRVKDIFGTMLEREVIKMLVRVIKACKNELPFATVDSILSRIARVARWQGMVVFNEDEGEDDGLSKKYPPHKIAEMVVRVLEYTKVSVKGRISFVDQIWLPVVNGYTRPWFQMVVIDECQDMNATQILLIQKACKKNGRIVVIGDDRQAIYDFRGADTKSLDRLKSELKAEELPLTTTFRCGKQIVELAQTKVPDITCPETAHSATVDIVARDKALLQAKPGDFILSRVNAPLVSYCLSLLRMGTPARIEGRDIGRELLVVIEKCYAPDLKTFIALLNAWEEGQLQIARARLGGDGQEEALEARLTKIEDTALTIEALTEGALSVDEVKTRCFTLFSDADNNPRPAVVCSSVHRVKGLEADRVFLLRKTFKAKGFAREEEHNIWYVAVTRARHHLSWVVDAVPDTVQAPEKTAE